MLQRMSGDIHPESLEVLAAVVQPPLGYQREDLKKYSSASALNHLVDAVPPESETARKFNQLAVVIAAGKASPAQWQQSTLGGSEVTAELGPLSHSLSQVAGIGLKALDDLKNRRAVNADEIEKDLQLLKAAGKPKAVLLDKVVPSVELLVNAGSK